MEFDGILEEAPPPWPKKLLETPTLGLRRCSSARLPRAPAEHKALRRPRWEPGARSLRRAAHKGCAHRPTARSPAEPPPCLRGLRHTGTPGTSPPAPHRAQPLREPPPPPRRAAPNKAPGSAHRQPLAVFCPRPPLLLPLEIQAQRCGLECGRLPRSAAHSAAPARCPPISARGRAPAHSERSSSGQRLNLQTSSSSRPGRGVCETPLLHAAPAAQPLPQPLPGEAWPGSGLVLALLCSPSPPSSAAPSPRGRERGGREINHSDLSLEWSQREQSDYSPGKKKGGEGMGDKKKKKERGKKSATVLTQGKALGCPALPRVSGHSLSARLPAPSPPPRAAHRLLSATTGLEFSSQV